jgi:hypothetical protein
MADLTGRELNSALISLQKVAKQLKSSKISPELCTAAHSLQEQAEWFVDAIQDESEWDVSGMENCIQYMASNVNKLETSNHKLIAECVRKYAR